MGGLVKKLKQSPAGMLAWKAQQACLRKLDDLEVSPEKDERITREKYRLLVGRDLNLDEPRALSEKMQWIKLHCKDELRPIVTDKYTARLWIAKHYGQQYLPECYLVTRNPLEIRPENLPDKPFIIKTTSGSGTNLIVRSKDSVDWPALRKQIRHDLKQNYYKTSQEWHYKDNVQRVIVEKLLQTSNGTIPNDYKLMFFNGKLVFTYCSIDREGANYRKIYDPQWQPLPFKWIAKGHGDGNDGPEIPAPPTYEQMVEIGSSIARLFSMVRVDFYDVDGRLYIGEITLMHGGGFNIFEPMEYDYALGDLLDLSDDIKRWG